ncbi:MAG: hypothetical protein AAF250_11065 [Pseudomonadota bacterium]
MNDDITKISEDMAVQFSKDLGYVSDMKENPRNAIMTELGVFWNFVDQKQRLFDQPNLL